MAAAGRGPPARRAGGRARLRPARPPGCAPCKRQHAHPPHLDGMTGEIGNPLPIVSLKVKKVLRTLSQRVDRIVTVALGIALGIASAPRPPNHNPRHSIINSKYNFASTCFIKKWYERDQKLASCLDRHSARKRALRLVIALLGFLFWTALRDKETVLLIVIGMIC